MRTGPPNVIAVQVADALMKLMSHDDYIYETFAHDLVPSKLMCAVDAQGSFEMCISKERSRQSI